MASTNEFVDPANPTATVPSVPATNVGDQINPQKVKDMVTVLENLLNHTHLFYDDYGTACNCNCNCNCTRGSL